MFHTCLIKPLSMINITSPPSSAAPPTIHLSLMVITELNPEQNNQTTMTTVQTVQIVQGSQWVRNISSWLTWCWYTSAGGEQMSSVSPPPCSWMSGPTCRCWRRWQDSTIPARWGPATWMMDGWSRTRQVTGYNQLLLWMELWQEYKSGKIG